MKTPYRYENAYGSRPAWQEEAARLLGLKPTTLNGMIKHNILLPRDRDRERRAVKEPDEAEKPAPA